MTLTAPYLVGDAWLAFAAGPGPSLPSIVTARSVNRSAIRFANGSTWSPFKAVAHTWSVGGAIGMVAAKAGVRSVASVDNAGYYPVVSKWSAGKWSAPTPTRGRHQYLRSQFARSGHGCQRANRRRDE